MPPPPTPCACLANESRVLDAGCVETRVVRHQYLLQGIHAGASYVAPVRIRMMPSRLQSGPEAVVPAPVVTPPWVWPTP